MSEQNENRELLQAVLDAVPHSIAVYKIIYAPNGAVDDFELYAFNEYAYRMAGDVSRDIIGKRIREIFSSVMSNGLFRNLRTIATQGEPADWIHNYEEDNIRHWYHITVTKKEDLLFIAFEDVTEQQQAARELKESKELLQTVFDAAPNSIAVMKILYTDAGEVDDFEILKLNAYTYNKIIPFGPEEVNGKRFTEVFPHSIQTGLFNKYKKVAKTGIPIEIEEWYDGEGMRNWFFFHIVRLDGLLIVATEDITEQKKATQESTENKELLQSMFDASPNLLCVFDILYTPEGEVDDFEMLLCNRTVYMITGHNPGELKGARYSSIFPTAVRNGIFDKLKTVARTGEATDFEVWFEGDGMAQWLRCIFSKLNNFIMVTVAVITERKKAEIDIREKNLELENFKRIIESTHDVILCMDLSGVMTYCNPAAEALYGYSTEEMRGKKIADTIIPAVGMDEMLEVHQNIIKGQSVIDLVSQNCNKSGAILDILLNAFPLKNEHGEFIGCCAIVRDITEQLKSQRNIEELNNKLIVKNRELKSVNSELKTFTNIAANDYNETLRNLYTNLEYIITNDAPNLSNTGRGNIRKAQGAIQKMKLLTEDIVAFTKLHELDSNMQLVKLDVVLHTVLDDFKTKLKDLHGHIAYGPMPSVMGYPFLISLVFHHLIDNAIKFRRDGIAPDIQITCATFVAGNDIMNEAAQTSQQYHIISVTDNGIGFAKQNAEDIFQIFHRLHTGNKYKGSGIGLAICKKVMELHGGFITAEGEPDKGSAFHCYFPVKR